MNAEERKKMLSDEELIALYWGMSSSTISALKKVLGSSLNDGIVISDKVARQYSLHKNAVYFNASAPIKSNIYITKSGEAIKKKDFNMSELNNAVNSGAIHKIYLNTERTKRVDMTIINAEDASEIIDKAVVDIDAALSEYGWLFTAMYGSPFTEDMRKYIDVEHNSDLTEALLVVASTYANKHGLLDITKTGMSKETIDSVVAAMNANYVHSIIK